jgi:tRNA(Ile)-lysidine synthase
MSNHALAFTAERLLHILQSLPGINSYIVGFSGGADSTALLHALIAVQDQLDARVSAVHVNHGLHENADLWQLQCEQFCQRHKIELVCFTVSPKSNAGKGLEAEARHLRYAAVSGLLKSGSSLLTAHHADDQAETLLLNLMRGSGVDGLSGMPASRPLGEGLLQRPLLGFRNVALRNYLRENHVEWTEDPSNRNLNYDRNFMRHEIIPSLEERWPGVTKRLLLTSRAMTDARHLLERLADDYIGQNLAHPQVLNITPQTGDDPALFKLVIRHWMKHAGTASIPAYRLESLCEQVENAGSDNAVTVHWGGWSLRLYQQQLWLDSDLEILPCPVVEWPPDCPIIELGDDAGQLVITQVDDTGVHWQDQHESGQPDFPEGKFYVGARVNIGASTIRPGDHNKSLKNLFQAANIPPWFRDCIPLCKLDGELVAIGDWCFNQQFAAWLSEHRCRLSWQPRNPLLKFIHRQQHPEGTQLFSADNSRDNP